MLLLNSKNFQVDLDAGTNRGSLEAQIFFFQWMSNERDEAKVWHRAEAVRDKKSGKFKSRDSENLSVFC